MKISKETLLAEASTSGFRPEILEKVFHLITLLNGFSKHPFLKGKLALKGGSALNLFIFDLPRLSVDVDLNYVGSHDREVMIAERPMIEKAIVDVCQREGLKIESAKNDEHAGITFFARYESAQGQRGNLKIDLNFMFRIPLWPCEKMNSFPIGSYIVQDFPMLDIHELAGGKLSALLSRHASRDLFDVHALLRCGRLDPQRLRLAFILYGAMNRKDWRSIEISDVKFTMNDLKKELLPVIKRKGPLDNSPVDWAQSLVANTRELLSNLLPFTEMEKEFLDRLLDDGEIESSLLTNDTALATKISQHPSLKWKALNVKQFKKL